MNDNDYEPEGRTQNFGTGILSGGLEQSPSLLSDTQARFNARVPKEYVPNGSASGTSADQMAQTMNGMLPVNNGSAVDTYESKKWFHDE